MNHRAPPEAIRHCLLPRREVRGWLVAHLPSWLRHQPQPRRCREFVWLRCASQGQEHAVLYDNLAHDGLIEGTRGVCGHFVVVVPAVLVGPSGRRCRRCKTHLPVNYTQRRYPTKLALAEDLLQYAFWHPAGRTCPQGHNDHD